MFGGPNYGLSEEECHDFLCRYPAIDFHIVKEGELAMVELVKNLVRYNFDVESLTQAGIPLHSCHFMKQGQLVTHDLLPRIKNLEELASPYLIGLMDKFFDTTLVPMIHTTRGCPFKCTFCTEGALYYQKVAQRIDLKNELDYITARLNEQQDLYISDANFGMFKEDINKAKLIAQFQEKSIRTIKKVKSALTCILEHRT